jgi:TetR/AcrR family transcriptional regulator, lmrAB and yxaGH operons repressor
VSTNTLSFLSGTARLLATKGVEGTAFADVLAATDAPRGSVYHHFPSGKTELLHAALELASERGLEIIEATRGQSAAVVVGRFLDLWRELLDRSHFSAGCAVVAVTVAANDAKLLDHAGAIFRAWTERLADLFVVGGLKKMPPRTNLRPRLSRPAKEQWCCAEHKGAASLLIVWRPRFFASPRVKLALNEVARSHHNEFLSGRRMLPSRRLTSPMKSACTIRPISIPAPSNSPLMNSTSSVPRRLLV